MSSEENKLNKNKILTLTDLHPEVQLKLVAQYGGTDCMTYVYEAEFKQKTYQGIGPSKKKSKIMVCEQILIQLGLLSEMTEPIPDKEEDVYLWEDFTSDIADRNCRLFYDFDYVAPPEVPIDVDALRPAYEIQQEQLNKETNQWLSEVLPEVYQDERFAMIGKNAVSIMTELYPYAEYSLINARKNTRKPHFLYALYVDHLEFRGAGINKKLAKARAAREALKNLCNMEFGTAEDGMPLYEGDERIWHAYKKKLEEEAEQQIYSDTIKNPVTIIHELFSKVDYTFENDKEQSTDNTMVFVACVTIAGKIFKGSGLSKKAAKSNAAANALMELEADGTLAVKRAELEEKLQEKERKWAAENEKERDREREKDKDKDAVRKYRNAVTKLSDLASDAKYRILGETSLKNTLLTAFTVAVTVDGKDYIGVGKTKKMARQEAAEKALKTMGHWDLNDERAKKWASCEDRMSGFTPNYLAGMIRRNEAPVDLMQLMQDDFLASDGKGKRGKRYGGRGKNFGGMENLEMYLAEMLLSLSDYFGWGGGYGGFDNYNEPRNRSSRSKKSKRSDKPMMGNQMGHGNVVPLLDEYTMLQIKSSNGANAGTQDDADNDNDSVTSPDSKKKKCDRNDEGATWLSISDNKKDAGKNMNNYVASMDRNRNIGVINAANKQAPPNQWNFNKLNTNMTRSYTPITNQSVWKPLNADNKKPLFQESAHPRGNFFPQANAQQWNAPFRAQSQFDSNASLLQPQYGSNPAENIARAAKNNQWNEQMRWNQQPQQVNTANAPIPNAPMVNQNWNQNNWNQWNQPNEMWNQPNQMNWNWPANPPLNQQPSASNTPQYNYQANQAYNYNWSQPM